jgi:hypothetical protein
VHRRRAERGGRGDDSGDKQPADHRTGERAPHVAVGDDVTTNDRASHAKVGHGLGQPEHDKGQGGDAEVRRREEASEQCADKELRRRSDQRRRKPPLDGAYGSGCEALRCRRHIAEVDM